MTWPRPPGAVSPGPRPAEPPGGGCRSESGGAAIEMTVAVTAFILVALLAVGGLRITTTRSHVSASAREGARAAAQAYGPAEAEAAASAVVGDVLAAAGVACRDLQVTVSGDYRPGAIVTTTVVCQVELRDVALAGFPGRTEVRATGVEMTDVVRGGGR